MREQLVRLREAMRVKNIDFYLIPTDDFHGSEYVGDYFKCRAFVSGFTGSAGTLLVGAENAYLWTDGRYFLQAEAQLAGSGITLMKMGEKDVPTSEDFIFHNMENGMTLGFDGRCVSSREYGRLKSGLDKKGARILSDVDLVDAIWKGRPALSSAQAWALEDKYSGKPRGEKLREMRAEMKELGADAFVLTSLEDIAWLLNLRGGDVECTPVFLSYFALTADDAVLFVNPSILGADLVFSLSRDGVGILPYDAIYDYVSNINPGQRLLLDGRKVNSAVAARVQDGVEVVDKPNPTLTAKAVKNDTECANARIAHTRDGVALTKFMYRLKNGLTNPSGTELSLADELEELRKAQEHYLFPSFSPIVSFRAHGAIVHYSATEDSDVPVSGNGFLLVDTGGHYLEGTTDVTRTFALGRVTRVQKAHYTAVLRGNLALASARFPRGVTGANLDALARRPLWELGLDYNHGTGHGVGYLLSVHEGPNAFRWRIPAIEDNAPLAPGMITSDEPGLYVEGEYGIRLENLLLCVPDRTTAFGDFLKFETLTLCPFDLDAVEPELMSARERRLLNDYHARVRAALRPYMTDRENEWLAKATRKI
jgi:Xaa-Pro aminopeptidase